MKSIFIGFLFIFLDFNLNLGQSRIELIPDFVGYILLANGAEAMTNESPHFEIAKSFSVFMVFCTGATWFLNLCGVLVTPGLLSVILGIASTIISLYIPYKVILGVKEIEEFYDVLLNSDRLKSAWTVLTIFSLLSFFFILIPVLAIPCVLVSLVAAICFLIAFSRTKNIYEELKGQ